MSKVSTYKCDGPECSVFCNMPHERIGWISFGDEVTFRLTIELDITSGYAASDFCSFACFQNALNSMLPTKSENKVYGRKAIK